MVRGRMACFGEIAGDDDGDGERGGGGEGGESQGWRVM